MISVRWSCDLSTMIMWPLTDSVWLRSPTLQYRNRRLQLLCVSEDTGEYCAMKRCHHHRQSSPPHFRSPSQRCSSASHHYHTVWLPWLPSGAPASGRSGEEWIHWPLWLGAASRDQMRHPWNAYSGLSIWKDLGIHHRAKSLRAIAMLALL